jgi:hypothetical protein
VSPRWPNLSSLARQQQGSSRQSVLSPVGCKAEACLITALVSPRWPNLCSLVQQQQQGRTWVCETGSVRQDEACLIHRGWVYAAVHACWQICLMHGPCCGQQKLSIVIRYFQFKCYSGCCLGYGVHAPGVLQSCVCMQLGVKIALHSHDSSHWA